MFRVLVRQLGADPLDGATMHLSYQSLLVADAMALCDAAHKTRCVVHETVDVDITL